MDNTEFIVFGIPYISFWIFTLVKIKKNDLRYPSMKEDSWFNLVLFLPFLGLVLFWLIGRHKMAVNNLK